MASESNVPDFFEEHGGAEVSKCIVRPNGLVDSWMVVQVNRAGETVRVVMTGLTRAASERFAADVNARCLTVDDAGESLPGKESD